MDRAQVVIRLERVVLGEVALIRLVSIEIEQAGTLRRTDDVAPDGGIERAEQEHFITETRGGAANFDTGVVRLPVQYLAHLVDAEIIALTTFRFKPPGL